MFLREYDFYIADYKLVVVQNRQNMTLNFLFQLAFLVTFSCVWYRGWSPDSLMRFAPLPFFLFAFRAYFKATRFRHILEVDSLAQTVLLREEMTLEYKDVLWIEISGAQSGGYTMDYLKLMTSAEDFEKVLKTNDNIFHTDRKARELAAALSDFMHKEFKAS